MRGQQALSRESWGYRFDEDYYSDRHIIESLDRVLAMGGDYILNVGPKADGSLPVETTPWHWQEPPCLRLSGLPVNRMTGTVMVIRLDFGEDVVA